MIYSRILPLMILTIAVAFGLAIPATAEQTAHAARGTITVDGKVDDAWLNTEEISTTRLVAELTTLESANVASAKVRLLWDKDHLYLLADVTDPQISTRNGNSWAQDSIEIYIDENFGQTKGLQPDDCQYRVSAMGDLSAGGYADVADLKAKVVPITGGYRVEAAIKSKSPFKSNQKIGMELQVNNDPGTGQRESVAKWNHAGNDSWHSTANYGSLILVEKFEPRESVAEKKSEVQSDDADKNRADDVPALDPTGDHKNPSNPVPDWAADAVFYQIFPERFRNGDPTNDPTRESLEFPDVVPETWKPTPWTNQWYQRADWERQLGGNFYDDGVFHRRYGGDLAGVIEKLDYLSRLGVNTIYFNPVFYARSLHKYDGNSFHHIDPYFGPDPKGDLKIMSSESADPATWQWTAADKLFLELLRQCHSRKIRVIIDGVFNHTGRNFFAFEDLVQRQQDSEYGDWYMVESFDDPATETNEFKYKGWWGVHTLPEFADNSDGSDLHPAPKEYVFHATTRWMDPDGDGDPSDGIDGWRLDVANEVPNKFWRAWNAHVRRLNPQAYTVAEIWENAGDYLQDCGFSATMNYHGFAFPAKGFLIDGRLSASGFADMVLERMKEHDPAVMFGMQNLFDSHDTDRIASMIVNAQRKAAYRNADRFDYDVGEQVSARHSNEYLVNAPDETDRRIQRLATLFQLTFVGAPMIYYGTEAGMDGGDDPDDRMPMVWDDLEYQPRTLGPRGPLSKSGNIEFDDQLFAFFQKLIKLRHQHLALRRGSFKILDTDDESQLFVFGRRFGNERMVVCLNRGKKSAKVDLSDESWMAGATGLKLLLDSTGPDGDVNTAATSTARSGPMNLRIPPLTGQIWRVDKAGGATN